MKKNILKFVLDAVMGIVFALLFNTQVLGGLTFHEIAGLAIGCAVIFHILLNAKWVKKVTVGIFSPRTKGKQRLEYILDVLCLVDLAVIIVTGVLISKVLFPSLGGGDNHSLQGIHTATSYIGLLLIGVHLGLHRQWIVSTVRNLFKIKGASTVRRVIGNVCAIVLLACGIYFMNAVNYVQQVASLTGSAQYGQTAGMSGGDATMQAPDGSSGTDGTMQAPDGSSAPNGGTQSPDGGAQAPSGKGQKGDRGSTSGSSTTSGTTSSTTTAAMSTADAAPTTTAAAATTAAGGADSAQAAPNGQGMQGDTGDGSGNGMMDGNGQGHGKGGDANPLMVALTYFSILGAFAVLTGYIEMLINRLRKDKKNAPSSQAIDAGSAVPAHTAPTPMPYGGSAVSEESREQAAQVK